MGTSYHELWQNASLRASSARRPGADPAAHDLAALHRPDDGRRAPHHGAGVGLVPALEHAAEDAADAPLLDGGRRQQGVADDGVVVVRALAPLPYGGVE